MTRTRNCEVYIDGASRGNPGPAGIGVVFVNSSAQPVHQFAKSIGISTNNVAEYLAFLYALQEALRLGYQVLTVKTDSELLARQIAGEYKVRDATLRAFYELGLHLMTAFRRCDVQHIPRTANRLADRLAGHAAIQLYQRADHPEAGRSGSGL